MSTASAHYSWGQGVVSSSQFLRKTVPEEGPIPRRRNAVISDWSPHRRKSGTLAHRYRQRRAQQAFPADFWINQNLGFELRHCEPPQNEEAIRFLTVAVALRPDSPGVQYNLGNALAVAGRFDEAKAAYRQAIGLKPDYAMAHFKLGWVLGQQRQLDEAIAACRRAIELKPDHADAHYLLGNYFDDAGQPGDAEAAYRRAIALRPDHAESHCNLGMALWKQGKLALALLSLERGHELGSRRKDWRYPSAQWVRECRRQLELERGL